MFQYLFCNGHMKRIELLFSNSKSYKICLLLPFVSFLNPRSAFNSLIIFLCINLFVGFALDILLILCMCLLPSLVFALFFINLLCKALCSGSSHLLAMLNSYFVKLLC